MKSVTFKIELIHVDNDLRHASDILRDYKDVDLKDEQYLKMKEWLRCSDQRPFEEIDDAFRLIRDDISKPLFAQVEQLYREYGYSEDIIKDEMLRVGACVIPILDEVDDEDVVESLNENGILIDVFSDGRKRIVACQNSDIELLSTDCHIIAPHAFFRCRKLREVHLPNAILIDKGAFSHCPSLRNVELSSNIRCINNEAFRDCYFLRDINLCEGLEMIEDSAFQGCIHLNPSITLPKSVTHIGKNAFAFTPLEGLQIP